MPLFEGFVYPLVLGFSAFLALSGLITLVWIRTHRFLKWVVTAAYVVTAIEVLGVINVMLGGGTPIVITVGYMLASIALLPLLGIGRLGEPDAAAEDPDPDRPVLAPDQIARVDGAVAIIVAIAMAVVAWRIDVIFQDPDVNPVLRIALVVVYAVLALAAAGRSVVQISTKFSEAPLAYSISLVSAILYAVIALAIWRGSFRLALWGTVVELAGVLVVGTLGIVESSWWPDATVWTGYGSAYGWVPLVLPIVALVSLARGKDKTVGSSPDSATAQAADTP